MSTSRLVLVSLLGLSAATLPAIAQEPANFGFGHPATPEEIKGWNVDVRPDGTGLPPGGGTAAQGREIYNQRCASCHADDLKGPMGALVGGKGTLATDKPLRTVGSYWPYATTLWDYVRRAMPFDAPRSLSDDEVYAVAAYVLFRNDIIGENDTMNATTLPQVEMPNRDGFYPDTRPDVFNPPCQHDCKRAAAGQQTRQPGNAPSGTAGQTGIGGGGSPQ
jgi:cytochrome c